MRSDVLKFACRLLWGRLIGKGYPFLVQLSVTNRCNARCRHCYATYYDRSQDDMSIEDVEAIINDLARAGAFRINLVGGEPLLREDIGRIIDHVRGKGVNCAMTTNGFLVPRKIEALKNLNTVCVSIDGNREGNDFNRGAGAFDKAIAALDACMEAGIQVQLSAVLTEHTVNDVDFIVSLAEKYDCKVGFTTLISPSREGRQSRNDLYPNEENIKGALSRIIDLKKQGKPILFSASSYAYAYAWPDHGRDIIKGCVADFKAVKCYAGKYFCLIDYNGDLYPCPQLVGIFKPGNVLRDGFDEAFRKTSGHDCHACSMPCSTEFNMFFSLNPKVLLERFLNR